MFVYNVLLKCPQNLVKDILKDGLKEIKELFGDENIQDLLAFPEDLPTVNINISKRLDRKKNTQISMCEFILIERFFSINILYNFR